MNGCFSLVGTAAVDGVMATETPELMVSTTSPHLIGVATVQAQICIWSPGNLVGSGRVEGARYVAVPVVCSLEIVPKLPSLGQSTGVLAGFGVPLEAMVVVV